MRKIMIGWLYDIYCEVANLDFTFRGDAETFLPETFVLAVNLVDKYTQSTPDILTSNYQMLGAACFMVACKHNEYGRYYHINYDFWTNLADGAFEKKEFQKFEWVLMEALDWKIGNASTLLTELTERGHNVGKPICVVLESLYNF